jgi:hypothetical protein
LTPWHPGFDPYCSILYIYPSKISPWLLVK